MGMVDHNTIPFATEAFGLDLSATYAAVVRAWRNRSGIQYETILTASDQAVSSALPAVAERIQRDTRSSHGVTVGALPVTQGSTRWLTAALSQPAKARRVLPSLLDVHLPFPLESCVYGFLGLQPTDDGQLRALAVVAREAAVSDRLAEMARWNMDPHVLDHEGLACWDYHQQSLPSAEREASIVVYLGQDRTVWAAGYGDRLTHTHATQRALAPHTEDTWHERITRMLRGTFSAAGTPTVHWYWTGPGATDDVLRTAAEERLQRQPIPLTFHMHTEPSTFLARALACRVLNRSPWAWNYRQGTMTHPEMVRRRTVMLRRTAWTGIAAGLCLMAINLGVQRYTQAREQAADAALAEWTRAITGHDHVIRGQEVLLAERALADQQPTWAPLLAAQQPGVLHEWAALLRAGARHELHFDVIRLRPDEIQVRGTAQDWNASETFAQHLEQQGWQVNLQQQDVTDTRRVRFRIDAHRGGTRS